MVGGHCSKYFITRCSDIHPITIVAPASWAPIFWCTPTVILIRRSNSYYILICCRIPFYRGITISSSSTQKDSFTVCIVYCVFNVDELCKSTTHTADISTVISSIFDSVVLCHPSTLTQSHSQSAQA